MAVISVIAIVVSPLVAVVVSVYLQGIRERRQQQLWTLNTLIANRSDPLTPDNIRALNLIDLIFHKKPRVRQLWREYFDMLSNKGLDNETGWKQRSDKNVELITEMAGVLGYGKAISHLDVGRVYNPVGIAQQREKTVEAQEELLRVLKATAKFEVAPRVAPVAEGPPRPA